MFPTSAQAYLQGEHFIQRVLYISTLLDCWTADCWTAGHQYGTLMQIGMAVVLVECDLDGGALMSIE